MYVFETRIDLNNPLEFVQMKNMIFDSIRVKKMIINNYKIIQFNKKC